MKFFKTPYFRAIRLHLLFFGFLAGLFLWLTLSPLFIFAKITCAVMLIVLICGSAIFFNIRYRDWKRLRELPSEPAMAVFESELVDIGELVQILRAYVKKGSAAATREQLRAEHDFLVVLGLNNLMTGLFKSPDAVVIRISFEDQDLKMIQLEPDRFALVSGKAGLWLPNPS